MSPATPRAGTHGSGHIRPGQKGAEEGAVAKSDTWNSRKRQALAVGSKVGYHHRSLTGRFGGGKFWLRFAFKKANRWKMRCAGSSGRFSRRTSSRKSSVTPTTSSPVRSVASRQLWRASGIVRRLVKSRIEFFTRREIDRSGGFREKQLKAAKRRTKTGTARRGGAINCSVSPVSGDRSLSGYVACPPSPEHRRAMLKPAETREARMAAQHATRVQVLRCPECRAEICIPPHFSCGPGPCDATRKRTGNRDRQVLDRAVTDFGVIPCEASRPWNSPIVF